MKFPQWVEDRMDYIQPVFFILLSFGCFFCLQYAVRWYLFGKCHFRTFNYFKFALKRRKRSKPVPPSQSLQAVPPNKKWRISNETISLLHSAISGVWALYALLMYPKLASEMNSFVDKNPLGLVYLSFGYLLHDLIDLLWNERSYRIIELLFHHVIVLTALTTTLVSRLFLGVVVFGLLMEINSIFLHTRSLMNLYGQPKNSTSFKFVALLNILSFALFRMCVSAYLLYWQFTNALTMPWYLIIITFIVIVSLATTNTVLLYRVLAADGLLGGKRSRQATSLTNTSGGTGGGGDRLTATTGTLAGDDDTADLTTDEARTDDDDLNGDEDESSSDFEDYDDEDEHDDIEACTEPPGHSHHHRLQQRRRRRKQQKQQQHNSQKGAQRRDSATIATQTAANGAVVSAPPLIHQNNANNGGGAASSSTPIIVSIPPHTDALITLERDDADGGQLRQVGATKIYAADDGANSPSLVAPPSANATTIPPPKTTTTTGLL